jgi:hypothetical protein
MPDIPEIQTGLVLSGGGACGAYEVGIVKAFNVAIPAMDRAGALASSRRLLSICAHPGSPLRQSTPAVAPFPQSAAVPRIPSVTWRTIKSIPPLAAIRASAGIPGLFPPVKPGGNPRGPRAEGVPE